MSYTLFWYRLDIVQCYLGYIECIRHVSDAWLRLCWGCWRWLLALWLMSWVSLCFMLHHVLGWIVWVCNPLVELFGVSKSYSIRWYMLHASCFVWIDCKWWYESVGLGSILRGMIRVVYLPCTASNVFIFYVCCRRDVVRCVGVVIRVRKRLFGVHEH